MNHWRLATALLIVGCGEIDISASTPDSGAPATTVFDAGLQVAMPLGPSDAAEDAGVEFSTQIPDATALVVEMVDGSSPDTSPAPTGDEVASNRGAAVVENGEVRDSGKPQAASSEAASSGAASSEAASPEADTPMNRAPVFNSDPGVVVVSEDAPSGTQIFSIDATDPDGDRVSFRLLDGDPFLLMQSGALVVGPSGLDFETRTTYEIRVSAMDPEGLESTLVLIVSVKDVDDEAPRIVGNTEYSINERSVAPTMVGQLQATDVDTELSSLRYALATPSDLFEVDETTGEIRVKTTDPQSLRFYEQSSYVLNVAATDGTTDPVTVPVKIDLVNLTSGIDSRPSNNTCVAPSRPDNELGTSRSPVWPQLVWPEGAHIIAMSTIPEQPERAFALDIFGRVFRFATDAAVTSAETMLDFRDQVIQAGEVGALGLAVHPDFGSNGFVYVMYSTVREGDASWSKEFRLERYQMNPERTALDPSSATKLLDVVTNIDFHMGGSLVFGPDGLLYVSVGDAGNGPPWVFAVQNPNVLLGKILRLDVSDASKTYTIPPDNPYATGGGAPEIFATGFRNPYRMGFDEGTGQLWVGDVGSATWEEVNRVVKGGNYGWPWMEGPLILPACESDARCTPQEYALPEFNYANERLKEGLGAAVVGGIVYRGQQLPELNGSYVFADAVRGEVHRLVYDANGTVTSELINDEFSPFSIRQILEVNGELRVVTYDNIYRLIRTTPSTGNAGPAMRLSQTGCVQADAPTQLAEGLIGYELANGFDTNGLAKRRSFALPNDAKIVVEPSGRWSFPPGSVLLKDFFLDGKPIETRMYARHEDGGWDAYSYEWNDIGTDANLLQTGKRKSLEGFQHTFPSRAECGLCHTGSGPIGLETRQLNVFLNYPERAQPISQLETFEHIGVLEEPLAARPQELPQLPTQANEASAEQLARAYLATNCGYCHRPGGNGRGDQNWGFEVPFADTNSCDREPQLSALGLDSPKLIVPGNPDASILVRRMESLDPLIQMPPVGKHLVDEQGVSLVRAWIEQMPACP